MQAYSGCNAAPQHSKRQNTSIVSACVFEVLGFEVLPSASILLDDAWDLTGLKVYFNIKAVNNVATQKLLLLSVQVFNFINKSFSAFS